VEWGRRTVGKEASEGNRKNEIIERHMVGPENDGV
jgi:hypothetical protein